MPRARRSAELPILSHVLAVLGNDSRLEVLRLLSRKPMDVSTMSTRLGISMPLLSHSLGTLRDHGIVIREVAGTRRIYQLATSVTVGPCPSTRRKDCLRIRCRNGAELVLQLSRTPRRPIKRSQSGFIEPVARSAHGRHGAMVNGDVRRLSLNRMSEKEQRMAASYSQDLRDRMLAAYDRGGMTTKEIATVFSVSRAWARRVKQRRREFGQTTPRKVGSPGHYKVGRMRLAELVREHPRSEPSSEF